MEKELLMEIRVAIEEAITVEGKEKKIVMIPFTGEASGPYFTGKVIGKGVDTQTIGKDGRARLSARYMMEGLDREGNTCRVYIENEGTWEDGFRPTIITDSPVLSAWEDTEQRAEVEGIEGGVMIRIYPAE